MFGGEIFGAVLRSTEVRAVRRASVLVLSRMFAVRAIRRNGDTVKVKLARIAIATLFAVAGASFITSASTKHAASAATPEMCNGRSDPNLHVTAQANGATDSVPKYFVNVANDASGTAAGTLILSLPGSSERLVVTDWCRVWQHLPGQPSSGSCGMTYPAGAITAHAVGTTELDGQSLLVRTDVRQLATGEMTFRVRYRPLGTETATDDCETGWTKVPAEGWYPLDTFRVDAASTPAGYWLASSSGGVFSFNAPFRGSMGGTPLNKPVAAIVEDPVTNGYWLAASDGGVFAFNAPFFGSIAGTPLNKSIVGMAEDPPTDGYWLTASDGGVFALGAAPFYGSMGGTPLNRPVVGVASDPATGGYWLVAADGGVFAFNAPFYGSAGSEHLNRPIVGMASTPSGHGYWLVASDGGVFAYGDANYYGSAAHELLNAPVVGMSPAPSAHGYWLAGADGGVYAYGQASFYGSATNLVPHEPIVGVTAAS